MVGRGLRGRPEAECSLLQGPSAQRQHPAVPMWGLSPQEAVLSAPDTLAPPTGYPRPRQACSQARELGSRLCSGKRALSQAGLPCRAKGGAGGRHLLMAPSSCPATHRMLQPAHQPASREHPRSRLSPHRSAVGPGAATWVTGIFKETLSPAQMTPQEPSRALPVARSPAVWLRASEAGGVVDRSLCGCRSP